MTHRERMLAAIAGRPTDRIPWAPRLDLWAIAHRARGENGHALAEASTPQIADELGVACHAVRAEYTRPRDPGDLALRALGIDNHPDYPYRVELRDLSMTYESEGGRHDTRIETPAGEVTMRLRMTNEMAAEGISLPYVEKYPIEEPEDFDPVAIVFEHMEVVPTPERYAAFHERVGERGLAIASGPLAASPIHLLLHDVMAMERFFLCYAEDRTDLEALAARMDPLFEAMLEAVLQCKAEVIYWGANYDRDTTWPPFFREQVVPWLRRASLRVQAEGKYLLTHTDGENKGLLDLYPECRFDVAESVCPSPMSSCTLAQIRKGMGRSTTVWGGIPCVILLDQATDERGFERHMDELFAEIGDAEHLILGVSDDVPPDANLHRLQRIKDWIEDYGPVGAS